jgi:hypothetical protein
MCLGGQVFILGRPLQDLGLPVSHKVLVVKNRSFPSENLWIIYSTGLPERDLAVWVGKTIILLRLNLLLLTTTIIKDMRGQELLSILCIAIFLIFGDRSLRP